MIRFSRALAAAALAVSAGAMGQTQPLTLAEAQRLALARSQQLVANEAAAAATRDMAVAAGQLPDPVLKLGVDNVPLSGPERFSLSRDFMTMSRVGVMQEITRRDKRELRVQRAGREGDRLQAERQAVLAELQRETALAWTEAVYAQQALKLMQEQLGEARSQVDAAEVAFRAGRGSQADVFGARAALANLQDKLRQTERQAQSARLMLARWIGPDYQTGALAGAIDWSRAQGEQVASSGQWQHLPRLAVLQAQVDVAQTGVRQAEANTKSDWSVEAMYSRRGPAYSDMVSIGVSIPLQLDQRNRQDREVAAKLAMLAEAQARYDDALQAEQAAVNVLLNDWTSGKQRLDGLKADLLPAARNRTEAALLAYRTGQGDLASALSARRDEIDARLQVLEVEKDVARLWAQLNFLTPDPALATP